MTMKLTYFLAFLPILASAQTPARPAPQSAGTESGFAVFQTRCMTCHGNPNVERAPAPAAIREMAPERIYAALTTGIMKGQGDALSEDQRRMVATFMSGRPLGSLQQGDAKSMPNQCASNPPVPDPSSGPAWNGWGVNLSNARFQSAKDAGLTPADVPRLKLKWAFGFPTGLSAYGQPSVVSGRVFVGTDIGYIYSLDAKTGCVYWSFQTKGAVRNSMSVGAVKGQGSTRYGVFFGDAHANVYGLDAQDGHLLWTFYTIPGPGEFGHDSWPQDNDAWKHGGASVWQTPAVDPDLGLIYFTTGNPGPDFNGRIRPGDNLFSVSMVAVEAKTGKYRWHFQQVHHDIWDYDSPNPVMLFDVMLNGRLRKAAAEASIVGDRKS